METTVVVQRKKLGRPPKAASILKDNELNSEIALMQTELGSAAALVAISPVPDEHQTGGAVSSGQIADTGECRRSSRKKVIKFDVRDLLNKHRKPHKIQIEARIDSNAPSASSKAVALGDNLEKSDPNSKEKCFIEKTSIIQRSLAFEHFKHGPTQVPIPLKTEIFKPNQSSSLIVAQMESINSSTNQYARRQSKSLGVPVKGKNNIETGMVVPKRRGRPPKNRSLIEKLVTENVENEIKNKINFSSELSELVQRTNNKVLENIESEKDEQKEIDKYVNETEASQKELLIESAEQLKADSTETENNYNISEKCSNVFNLKDLNSISSNSIKERDLTDKLEQGPSTSTIDSKANTSVSSELIGKESTFIKCDDVLRENEMKFDPIEIVEESVRIVNICRVVDNLEEHILPATIVDPSTKPINNSNITLPLKKQLSKLQEVQAQMNIETLEEDFVLCLEQESEIQTESSIIKESNTADSENERKTSTPTLQRSERRSGRNGRLGDGLNKTLEETFAEIAANSSKEILEMTTNKADENNMIDKPIAIESNASQSLQQDLTENNSKNSITDVLAFPNRSVSPKAQISEQEIIQPKRRGRKPKPKVVAEEDDSKKLKDTIEEEKNANFCDRYMGEYNIAKNVSLEEKNTDESKHSTFLDKPLPNKENKSEENNEKSSSEECLEFSKDLKEDRSLDITSNTDFSKFTSHSNLSEIPMQTKDFPIEKSYKEHKIKKRIIEELSLSKILSKESQHRRRQREEHSSTSHKNERKSSKHRSSSSESKKKYRNYDNEEVDRKEKDAIGSIKKSKLSSKEEISEKYVSDAEVKTKKKYDDEYLGENTLKENETSLVLATQKLPSSIGEKFKGSFNKEKFGEINFKTSSTNKANSVVESFKERNENLKKHAPTFNERSSDKEKANISKIPKILTEEGCKDDSHKRNLTLTTEKSATDILRKSTLFSPERTVNEKTEHPTKEKSSLEDFKKISSSLTEKSIGESAKKSSSTSKEREFTESYIKKSPSIPKIKTFEDERNKKSVSLSREKLTEDSLKKHSYTTKEKASEDKLKATVIFEKKHDKKKHKRRSLDKESASIKLKTATSSKIILTTPPASLKESISSISSNKKTDDSGHKQRKKHRETVEKLSTKTSFKDPEICDDKQKSQIKELRDLRKEALKERQKKLKEAFKAAMEEVPFSKSQTPTQSGMETTNTALDKSITPQEPQADITDIVLPPTPGESDSVDDIKVDVVEQNITGSSQVEKSAQSTESKGSTVAESEPDPLYDIEKFIEAGVNLLKRDYKIDEEDAVVKANQTNTQKGNAEKTKLPVIEERVSLQLLSRNSGLTEDNTSATQDSEIKPEISEALEFYETPADTPISTPASLTPNSSPIPADNSVDTYYYSDGVRRSHRLKKITNAPKALVGRGLVRDRDRERLAMRDDVETKSYYSIEDHLMDLAEVELKNAKFLKEMEERLSNFEVIKENEYHCERVVSREARKMVCDCFLTPEEAERGELGCGEDCLNRLLMIECSANCKVGDRCTNKRFQKYLCAPCRVFRTEKKGFGIMADVEIHPGEFIMEYVGEVLDSEEFEDRRVAYSQDKNRHYYFMALRSDAIIDATIKGNISRFINHSCDPNAETQKWTVNGELRIGFFSRKTIMPGEEITFDYQYQRYGREAQRCYCESANCRGWIGEEPASDEGEQIDDDEDDDDDDDEYDEDESDVVSMVKGLMSVEDGDDDDGKDDILSEETRRSLQDAAVKAQLRKNQSMESLETSTTKEPNIEGETDESKQKFMAYLSKISAKIELHKKNVREEKKRKRRQRKKAANEKRQPTSVTGRFLEDPDLEDEVDFLSRCGLKNQSDTLRFSRLMVRAKLISTRLNLLAILRAGELPCRRLFLDYHGLHLLHGWINEDGRTDMTLRMALLETLECLPIANKTILTDSKVYQSIRSWCKSETLPPSSNAEGNSSSPSDDSSKESAVGNTAEKPASNADGETAIVEDSDSSKSELEKLAVKLLSSWDNLPEIFRIPKRERIEQMKEHEREADRQYAATVEAGNDEDHKEVSTDRYQRDRFERRFGRPQGARTITVLGGNTIGMTTKRLITSDVLSPEDTKHLSKEQRRELFAAKVARDEAEKRQAERRREFETKCTFFGIDPLNARVEDLPFCVSDSGQWYNEKRQLITTPPAFAHVQTPAKPMSTNPTDYYLPSAATKLPPEWTFAITEQGKIYYYHLKHRIPQWEPPTLEQINKTKWSDEESESEEDEVEGTQELSEERIKEIEAIETMEELNALLKKIVQEQRQARYKRLVDERPISPRREEDRIYNQIEMRKYKENKEKIKKRKEEIRRRRSEAIKNSMLNMCTLGSLEEKPSTSTAALADVDSDMPEDALPIQDYLLSSDEDNNDIDEMKAECNNSPLLDKIVQGDKIVDELDALTTRRQLKRTLPPHRELNFDLSLSNSMGSENMLSSIEKLEHKKRKQDKKEKSKRSKEGSDAKYRKLKEKFRCEIAGIIVQHLKPYRKDTCTFGRIKSNNDFNHLAKKLTHFVMIKELKYCESVGQTLVVTESVKNKSREFIRKYMAKYEAGYVKPDNDPEFKDIPYTL